MADELLEQQAARKLGHLPKDQLAASSALEKETLEHCTTCDSPTESCKHLHEPMVADIIITDRDAKPRKGSLHRQRWQRIAAYRRELLLTLFNPFEGRSVQHDSGMRDEEANICNLLPKQISGQTFAGSNDAKADPRLSMSQPMQTSRRHDCLLFQPQRK